MGINDFLLVNSVTLQRRLLKMSIVLEIEKEETMTTNERKKIKAKIRALRSLLNDDEKEQRQTFSYLKRALNEDRPSNRRLFK